MTHQVLHVHVLRVLRRARVGGEPWAAGARGWKPSPVAFVGPRVPRRATGLCTTSPPISARIRMTACGTGPSSSLSRRERGQHKCFWDRFLELNLAPMTSPHLHYVPMCGFRCTPYTRAVPVGASTRGAPGACSSAHRVFPDAAAPRDSRAASPVYCHADPESVDGVTGPGTPGARSTGYSSHPDPSDW